MKLPDWITQVDGYKSRFILDPDQFYPALLASLASMYELPEGGEPGAYDAVTKQFTRGTFVGNCYADTPDRYWLECVHQMSKLDAQLAIAPIRDPSVTTVFIVRGNEGFKERWALVNHPAGRRYAALQKFHGFGDAETVEDMTRAQRKTERAIALEARQHYKQLRGFLPT